MEEIQNQYKITEGQPRITESIFQFTEKDGNEPLPEFNINGTALNDI